MPAGIKYNMQNTAPERELCDVATIYRLSGGFNLEDEDLQEGAYVPPFAPLSIDLKTRVAKVVKAVKVVNASNATALQVEKGSLVSVGMHLGDGDHGATINAINRANENYDIITLSASISGVQKGSVLFEATAAGGRNHKNIANFLNYAGVKVEPGATVTAVGRAYQIKTDRLYVPISDLDKENLGDRFMFV